VSCAKSSRLDLPIAGDKTEAIAITDALHRDFATIIVIGNSAANTCKKLGADFCLHAARRHSIDIPKGVRLTSRTKARLAA
jgi:hypothetical protein